MNHLTLAIVLSATGVLLAQETEPPVPPPSQQPAVVKKREGGFHGITFVEAKHDGRAVLEVRAVLADSDAERLGFRKGDLILGVNGERLRNGDHFIQQLYGTVPGLRAGGRRRGGAAGADDKEAGNHVDVLRDGEQVRIAGGLRELDATPKVGDAAPDFTLADAKGEHPVTLSKLTGKKPVVLVFGSFT